MATSGVGNSTERAILVGLDARRAARGASKPEVPFDYSAEESLDELEVLATSAGASVAAKFLQTRSAPDAATLIGSGKVEELSAQAKGLEADIVIFDQELSPTQLRNLERSFDARVVDRTQLILDIFARRARTREGQLQVELAQLNYLLPRLSGRGIEMSRLGGGIGTRGPGETQLETDRRRIYRRVRKIEEDLETVRATRTTQRQQRKAVPLATVALVGYTNAGKSTLFNRLTSAGVLSDAKMFATLDPTVRSIVLPSRRKILLSDTVGFIRNLPTTLVKAFRATLEEVAEASLLLHVVDASSAHATPQTAHVKRVLEEIGAGLSPQILVWNKVDAMAEGTVELGQGIGVSARTGMGVDRLLERIDQTLELDPVVRARFRFPASDGGPLHMLHDAARVLDKRYEGEWCWVVADAPESIRKRLDAYLISQDN